MENEEKNLNETDIIDPNEVGDSQEEEVEGEKAEETEGKPTKQSQSQNAKYAQMRREAEAKAKAEREEKAKEIETAKKAGYREGVIATLKTNPYTEEPIEDDYDLEIYEIQQELDRQGKDPNKDLPRELARRRRELEKAEREKAEADEKSKQEAEAKKSEVLARKRKEIEEVRKKYDLTEEQMKELLDKDSDFGKKVKDKEDRWTLEEIFDAFYEKKPVSPKRGTPNSTPGGSKVEKSIMDMSDEEFLEWKKNRRG